jgi:GNAT superfamily N-acetyltransferase
MKTDLTTAAEFSCGELAVIFGDAFEGYVVPIPAFDVVTFATFLGSHQVDFGLSKVVCAGKERCGIGLVARFDGRSRVVAMGISAKRRAQGVGKRLLTGLVDDARERGDRAVVLEVIEQNPTAVALYKRAGFDVVRRLYGYQFDKPLRKRGASLQAASSVEFVSALCTAAAFDLPWQMSLPNLTRVDPSARIHRLEDTFVLVSNPDAARVTILTLFTAGGGVNPGPLKECLEALFHAYPGRTWLAPAIVPEEYDPVFVALGATRNDVNQVQMSKTL